MEPVDEPLANLVLLLEDERMLEELGLLGLDFLPIRPSCLSRWSRTSITLTSGAVSIGVVASCFSFLLLSLSFGSEEIVLTGNCKLTIKTFFV